MYFENSSHFFSFNFIAYTYKNNVFRISEKCLEYPIAMMSYICVLYLFAASNAWGH